MTKINIAKIMRLSFVICLVFTLTLILSAPVHAEEAWSIKGDVVDSCSCSSPCPCLFGSAPTHEKCKAVLAYQIREGAYGEIPLKGLSFGVALVIVPKEGFEYVAYYTDENASAEQEKALKGIFSSSSIPFAMMGKPLGIKDVAIKLTEPEEFGQPYTVTIGDVAKLEIAPIPGLNPKEPIHLTNPKSPFALDAMFSKTISGSFKDYDRSITFKGTHGSVGKFAFAGGKSEN